MQWYHTLVILPANSMITQLQKLWILYYVPALYSSVLFRSLHYGMSGHPIVVVSTSHS